MIHLLLVELLTVDIPFLYLHFRTFVFDNINNLYQLGWGSGSIN